MKSKTILIIIPHLSIGGTETQTLALTKGLIVAGYRVVILCLYRNIGQTVQQFREAGAELEIVSPEYDHYGITIQYQQGLELVKFLYRELKQSLSKYNPDIVHVQYVTPASSIILLLKYFFRHKNILATCHTPADIYSPRGLKLVQWISRHCLRGFQCITERAERSFFGKSELLSPNYKWQKRGNHFTIYNNIPSHISILDTRRKFNSNKITIGVVSRLADIKGMDLVIPAFNLVRESHPNVRLRIVGDGPQRELMRQQASESGWSDDIEFVGFQPQSELQSYYDRIDILLMPSRSEGFGLTAVEGMARGCVPVVANVGGLPEVVRDGIDGLLHEKESIEDLAAKINSLIESGRYRLGLLTQYSEAARERAKAFSTEVYNRQIRDLYDKL